MTVKTIHDVAYHRNGVGGEPFYVVTFTDDENGAMIGTVFGYVPKIDRPYNLGYEEPFNPQVAVLSLGILAEGNIKFGQNSWRGDQYAEALYQAIDAYSEDVEEEAAL